MHHFKLLNFLTDEYKTPTGPLDPPLSCNLSTTRLGFWYFTSGIEAAALTDEDNALTLTAVGTPLYGQTGPNSSNGSVKLGDGSYLTANNLGTLQAKLTERMIIDFWFYSSNPDIDLISNRHPAADIAAYRFGSYSLGPSGVSQSIICFNNSLETSGTGFSNFIGISDTGNHLVWYVNGPNTVYGSLHYTEAVLENNTWHHIMLDFSSQGQGLYFDGKLQKSRSQDAGDSDASPSDGKITDYPDTRFDTVTIGAATLTSNNTPYPKSVIKNVYNSFYISRLRFSAAPTDDDNSLLVNLCVLKERLELLNVTKTDYDSVVLDDQPCYYNKLNGIDGKQDGFDLAGNNTHIYTSILDDNLGDQAFEPNGNGLKCASTHYAYTGKPQNYEASSYNLVKTAQLATIEFWYKGAGTADAVIFEKNDSVIDGENSVAVLSTGHVSVSTKQNFLNYRHHAVSTTNPCVLDSSTWNHVVIRSDDIDSDFTITINDVACAVTFTNTIGGPYNGVSLKFTETKNLYIGYGMYALANTNLTTVLSGCEGSIKNLAFYGVDHRLTDARITTHYNAVELEEYDNTITTNNSYETWDSSFDLNTGAYYNSNRVATGGSNLEWFKTSHGYSSGKRYFEFVVTTRGDSALWFDVHLAIASDRVFDPGSNQYNFNFNNYSTTYASNGNSGWGLTNTRINSTYFYSRNTEPLQGFVFTASLGKIYPWAVLSNNQEVIIGVALDMVKRKVTYFVNGDMVFSLPVPLSTYYIYMNKTYGAHKLIIPKKLQNYPQILKNPKTVIGEQNEYNDYDIWGDETQDNHSDTIVLPSTMQNYILRFTKPIKYFPLDVDTRDISTFGDYSHPNMTTIGTPSFENLAQVRDALGSALLDGSSGFSFPSDFLVGKEYRESDFTIMIVLTFINAPKTTSMTALDVENLTTAFSASYSAGSQFGTPFGYISGTGIVNNKYGIAHGDTIIVFKTKAGWYYFSDHYSPECLIDIGSRSGHSLTGTHTSAPIYIGIKNDSTLGVFGHVSNVVVWDRELSSPEMDEIYYRGRHYSTYSTYYDKICRQLGVKVFYKFDEENNRIFDQTLTNKHMLAMSSSQHRIANRYNGTNETTFPTFATSLLGASTDPSGKSLVLDGTGFGALSPVGISGLLGFEYKFINYLKYRTGTFSCFVKFDTVTGHQSIFVDGSKAAGIEVCLYDGSIGFYATFASLPVAIIDSPALAVVDTVYHIVASYDSATAGVTYRLWIDSVLIGEQTTATNPPGALSSYGHFVGMSSLDSPAALALGLPVLVADSFLIGAVDEVALFNGLFEQTDVDSLYAARLLDLSDVNDGLLYHWKLEEPTLSTEAIDSATGTPLTLTSITTFEVDPGHGSEYDLKGYLQGLSSTMVGTLPSTLPTGSFSVYGVISRVNQNIIRVGTLFVIRVSGGFFEISDGTTTTTCTLADPTLLSSLFFCITYDTTDVTFYINGQTETISVSFNTVTAGTAITLGDSVVSTISDIAITQAVLTSAEVDVLYEKYTSPGMYKMLEVPVTYSGESVIPTNANTRIPAYRYFNTADAYIEVKIITLVGNVSLGFTNDPLKNLTNSIGSNTNEFGLRSDGDFYDEGITSTGFSFVAGDTVAIYIEATQITWYKKPSGLSWETGITKATTNNFHFLTHFSNADDEIEVLLTKINMIGV